MLKDDLVSLKPILSDQHENTSQEKPILFDCEEQVLKNISEFAAKFLPQSIRIKCLRIPTELLEQNTKLGIVLTECRGPNCQS